MAHGDGAGGGRDEETAPLLAPVPSVAASAAAASLPSTSGGGGGGGGASTYVKFPARRSRQQTPSQRQHGSGRHSSSGFSSSGGSHHHSEPHNYIPSSDTSTPSAPRSWSQRIATLLLSRSSPQRLPVAAASVSSFQQPHRRAYSNAHLQPQIIIHPTAASRRRCCGGVFSCTPWQSIAIFVVVITLLFMTFINNPTLNPPQPKPPSIDNYRLDVVARPIRYDLTVSVDFISHDRFQGNVSVEILVIKASRTVVMHAVDLEFGLSDVKILDGVPVLYVKNITADSERGTVTLHLSRDIQPDERFRIAIRYTGRLLENDAKGFYRSTYTLQNKKKTTAFVASTQFEPTTARRALACFDEPHLKAEFALTLESRVGDSAASHGGDTIPVEAASNMPVESTEDFARDASPWRRWRFAPSKPMSSYLFAWVVGHLSIGFDSPNSTTPVRVLGPIGSENLTTFAGELTVNSVALLEERFGSRLGMPKLDVIAIPFLPAEGMENYGIITIANAGVLLDTETATPDQRIYIANLVAHEIAHQWMGDLVTPRWWDNLFVAESFAEWLQHIVVSNLVPTLGGRDTFYEFEHLLAFHADAVAGHAVVSSVNGRSADISRLFDDISESFEFKKNLNGSVLAYNKGAAVLRMMHLWLDTPDLANFPRSDSLHRDDGDATDPEFCGKFCRAIKRLIARHSYGSVSVNDLCDTLDEEDPAGVASSVLLSFLTKPGFPVISVSSSNTIAQHAFTVWLEDEPANVTLADPIDKKKKKKKPKPGDNDDDNDDKDPAVESDWQIPLTIRYMNSSGAIGTPRANILKPGVIVTMPLPPTTEPNSSSPPFVIINPLRAAFARVLYTSKMLSDIVLAMRTFGNGVLSVTDRAGLFDDTFALLLSNHLKPSDALPVLDRLRGETHAVVWNVAASGLRRLDSVMRTSVGYGVVRSWMKGLVEDIAVDVGFPSGNEIDSNIQRLRLSVLPMAALVGRRETLSQAMDILQGIAKGWTWNVDELIESVVIGAVAFDPFAAVDLMIDPATRRINVLSLVPFYDVVARAIATSPHHSHSELVFEWVKAGDVDVGCAALVGVSTDAVAYRWLEDVAVGPARSKNVGKSLVDCMEGVVAGLKGGSVWIPRVQRLLDRLVTCDDSLVVVGLRCVWEGTPDEARIVALRRGLARVRADEKFLNKWGDEVVNILGRRSP